MGKEEIELRLRRGQRPTVKLRQRAYEKKREGTVPVVIDSFEPRMPQERSLERERKE